MGLKELKHVAFGVLVGCLLTACAGAVFSYKYYGIAAASYVGGKLVGPTASDDLDFSLCEPTPKDARPCIAMLSKEFGAMKLDYLDTKNRLISCERKLK